MLHFFDSVDATGLDRVLASDPNADTVVRAMKLSIEGRTVRSFGKSDRRAAAVEGESQVSRLCSMVNTIFPCACPSSR